MHAASSHWLPGIYVIILSSSPILAMPKSFHQHGYLFFFLLYKEETHNLLHDSEPWILLYGHVSIMFFSKQHLFEGFLFWWVLQGYQLLNIPPGTQVGLLKTMNSTYLCTCTQSFLKFSYHPGTGCFWDFHINPNLVLGSKADFWLVRGRHILYTWYLDC